MTEEKKITVPGIEEQLLSPCSNKPNCVSSEHNNLNRKMLPVSYDGLTLKQAKDCLFEVLQSMPRIDIKQDEGQFIRVEYRTMVFEFFHDAEFYFNEKDRKLQFRSSTRIGFADFGSNKRWLQSVIARFLQKIAVYQG